MSSATFNSLNTMMLRIDEIAEIFEDVTPLPQNDGPNPVCAIQYPTSFRLAFDYLRACWQSGEKSTRSWQLSGTCVKLNPANYTVWHYRRACMDALGYFDSWQVAKSKIQQDLAFSAQIGGGNPKNYQIWYHRRALLEAFEALTKDDTNNTETLESEFLETERAYIAGVLEQDSKNYHAWSHRQWLIRTIGKPAVWEEELTYVATLIQEDPRNNSAWNQRWFAVHRAIREPLPLEICRQEADFAIRGAELDPYNESPFRYLVGLFREQPSAASLAAEFYRQVQDMEQILKDADRDAEACCNWTSARIDLLESIGDHASLSKAVALAQGMASQYDLIREKYWQLRLSQLQEKTMMLTH